MYPCSHCILKWNTDSVTDPADWGYIMENMAVDEEMIASATRQELLGMNRLRETAFKLHGQNHAAALL